MILAQATEVAEAIERSTQGRSDTTLLAVLLIILFAIAFGAVCYAAVRLLPLAWMQFRDFMADQRSHMERQATECHLQTQSLYEKQESLQRETNDVLKANTDVMHQVKAKLS